MEKNRSGLLFGIQRRITWSLGGAKKTTIQDGRYKSYQSEQFSQIITNYLTNFLSEHTRQAYLNDLRGFVQFVVSNFPYLSYPNQISQEHIIAYRETLRISLTPNSVNRKLSALNSFFETLIQKQVVLTNPVRGIKRPPSIPKRARLGFTDEEVKKILSFHDQTTIQGLQNASLLHFLFYTGVRVSEMLSVRVRDIYEVRGLWFVDIRGKGDKCRTLPLHPKLNSLLQQLLKIRNKLPEDFLFTALNSSKALSRRAVSQLLERTLKSLCLDLNRSLHSARRTLISNLLERGAKIESVAKAAGHSDINTTQGYNVRSEKPEDSPLLTTRYG